MTWPSELAETVGALRNARFDLGTSAGRRPRRGRSGSRSRAIYWLGRASVILPHPPLTDVVVGAWASSLLLDCCGGERSRGGSRRSAGGGDRRGGSDGVGRACPTGPTCAARAGASGPCTPSAMWDRARSAVCCRGGRGGVATVAAASLCSASPTGIVSAAPWLGGHFSLGRAMGANETAVELLPGDWTAVLDENELGRGTARRECRPVAPASCSCAGPAGSTRSPTAARIAAARCTRASSTATRSSVPVTAADLALRGSLVVGPAASPQPRARDARPLTARSMSARHDEHQRGGGGGGGGGGGKKKNEGGEGMTTNEP